MQRSENRYYLRKRPRGLMQLEIVVAATLLGVVIAGIATLNYRLLGVAKDTRHYQFAIHEAAYQIELLTAPGLEGLDDRIDEARLSEDALQSLPGGVMEIQRIEDSTGTKVLVRIRWERIGAPVVVELYGWASTRRTSAQESTNSEPSSPEGSP
ncbi:MAG: hypothetical protein ACK6DC_02000 [Planctomycetota bacterium]|jgi:hypothetical protein